MRCCGIMLYCYYFAAAFMICLQCLFLFSNFPLLPLCGGLAGVHDWWVLCSCLDLVLCEKLWCANAIASMQVGARCLHFVLPSSPFSALGSSSIRSNMVLLKCTTFKHLYVKLISFKKREIVSIRHFWRVLIDWLIHIFIVSFEEVVVVCCKRSLLFLKVE